MREGHIDPEALRLEAEALQKRLKAADDDQSYKEAWDLYHGSFDDNANQVMEALATSIQKTPNAISPMNLSGTISILKDLHWTGDIGGLIDGYIVARGDEPREFWDLANDTFGGHVGDQDVRDAFAAKLSTFNAGKDPVEILLEIAKGQGWNPEDVDFLATLSVGDYYDIFKNLHGSHLKRAISGALHFRSIINAEGSMKDVTAKAVAALEQIGKESELNRRRVAVRGVTIQNAEPDQPDAPAVEPGPPLGK